MKNWIGFFTALLIGLTSMAQPPAFEWGTSLVKPALELDVKVYGNATDGFYVVNKRAAGFGEFNPTVTVDYFNGNMERRYSVNMTCKPIEDFAGIVYLNKSIYCFTALFSKEAGKNTLTARAFHSDGNVDEPVVIASMPAEKLVNRGLFKVAASPDGNKLLLVAEPNFVKEENERITLSLFDAQLKKIWSAEKTYSYQWTRAVENTPYVNNDGTAFIMKKTDMKGDNNTYSVFSFNGQQLKEFKIALQGKQKIHTHVEVLAPNGDLVVGGYYTEDAKVNVRMGTAIMGSFIQRIDSKGDAQKFYIVNPFEKRKDVVAKNILFHNNNTILMGERYYVNITSAPRDPSNPNQDPFAKDYGYNGYDVIIDCYDAAGKPMYASSIEKNNSSKNDNGTWVSYFGSVINGKLYIIFNDDKNRYDEKKKAITFGGTVRIVVYATVDPATGAVTPAQPIPNMGPVGGKESTMLTRPDVFLKVDENHYIIRAENRDEYRMSRVSF